MHSKNISPYKILNIAANASDMEIQRAFKNLALKFHPDRHTHNTDMAKHRFHLITDAYEKIKTAKQRTQYNRWLQTTKKENAAANNNWLDDFTPPVKTPANTGKEKS